MCLVKGKVTLSLNICSDRSMEVKLPVLLWNYDRQTNRPTNLRIWGVIGKLHFQKGKLTLLTLHRDKFIFSYLITINVMWQSEQKYWKMFLKYFQKLCNFIKQQPYVNGKRYILTYQVMCLLEIEFFLILVRKALLICPRIIN